MNRIQTRCGILAMILAAFAACWVFAQPGAESHSKRTTNNLVKSATSPPAKQAPNVQDFLNDYRIRGTGLPGGTTFFPVVSDVTFEEAMEKDVQAKPEVMDTQRKLLDKRYDLSDNPATGIAMSGGKPVQQGVRVKLTNGMTWEKLAEMAPTQIREQ